MSWIDAPLQGRNGAKQLPPIAQRAATPSSAGQSQNHNFKEFLPSSSRKSKTDDRGVTAAAWSRKLPYGASSQALRMVRTHLSPVEDALNSRHTARLEKAVQDASNGARYLQTVSVIRRSRSVPTMHRHALETALASHIVKAKVELGEWKKGVMEISSLRRARSPEKLSDMLTLWHFAEDDPVVLNARQDLERWKYAEKQMPSILKQAVQDRDLQTIRKTLKQLSISGPSDVEGCSEARFLVRRYDLQVQALKDATNARNVNAMQAALASWEFPEHSEQEKAVLEAQALLELRDEQVLELKRVAADERIDDDQLLAAVSGWEFESDNDAFLRAAELLRERRGDSEAVEQRPRRVPVVAASGAAAAVGQPVKAPAVSSPPEASSSEPARVIGKAPGVTPEFDEDEPVVAKKAPAGGEALPIGGAAADNSYTFEKEEYSPTFDESEAERDPYGADFDAEGDASLASPTKTGSPGVSPSPNKRSDSADDFEVDNDRSPAAVRQPTFEADDTAEFEADFEQDDTELGADVGPGSPAVSREPQLDTKQATTESFEFEEESPKAASRPPLEAKYTNEFEEDPDDDGFEDDGFED